ncbi:MAG: hypothetical protein SGCHY_003920 [Lobulomycetales sp.]
MLSDTAESEFEQQQLNDNNHTYSLPPFANAKNKSLSLEIRRKESNLTSLNSVFDDNAARADTMRAHMKNVQQEYVHTQALYDAKSRQIETEDHLKLLAEREAGRLENEIKRKSEEDENTQTQLTVVQSNIYKTSEQIENLRAELKFSKEELEEWARVQTEKEDDTLALLKYSKEDSAKIKQLGLTIEKLMHDVHKKKASLNAEVTETQVSQIELDKTTNEFKRLHQERQALIGQWESAIQVMNKRDIEIEQYQAHISDQKDRIRQLQSEIDEKQAFLDQQKDSNDKNEAKINEYDRQVSKARIEHASALDSLASFQDEVDLIRSTLSKTATELVNKRAEIVNLKSGRQEKQKRLEREKANRLEVKSQLAKVTDATISMEAKAQALQNMLRMEEVKSKELDRDLKLLREEQFKKNQELFRLKQEEKNIDAEITGGEASSKTLRSKISKLDQEALKQQALLYNQEFQIQQLERKVRRAQGDRTDEEKEILEQKITNLNKTLESQNKKHTLLTAQLKKSQEDLRKSRRSLDLLVQEKSRISSTIDELVLYNESASKQLAGKIKEKEEVMVEENILRLELRKLRGFLNSRADEVFTLESKQLYLQLALEERSKEMSIHKDMLRVQFKNAEEERQSACIELRDRVKKVETLKRRYELLMSKFNDPMEDEPSLGSGSSEDHSQAYYVIRASQKREELQREGDLLDEKIRKAEKEIKALENTLKMMNDRNEDYRMKYFPNSHFNI